MWPWQNCIGQKRSRCYETLLFGSQWSLLTVRMAGLSVPGACGAENELRGRYAKAYYKRIGCGPSTLLF